MKDEHIKKSAQQFLQFLSARDLNNLTDMFDKHVDWYIPGNKNKAPWLGVRNNQEEVKIFLSFYGKTLNRFPPV